MNAMNTSNLALQFASNIASFQSTLGKNTSDIAFNASNISTNMSSIANMQISLGTNTSNISDIYKTIGTYSTQTSNLARSFTDSIASQNNRLDDFNRTMGYYEVNTSNLSSKLTDNVATQNTKFDNMVSKFNTSNANMQYTINSNYNLLNNIISTYDMKTSNLLSSNMTFKDQIASLQQQDQAILNLQNQYNTVITEDTWQSKILASLQQQDKIITAEDIWQNQMLSALQSQGTSNIVANDLQNKQLTSLQDQGTSNISVNNLQNRQLSSLLPPVTYPPSALTSYSTVIGGNTYVAAASTERTNTLRSWKAFDNKVSSDPYMGWQTKDGCYNGTTWVATTNPAFDGFTPGDYSGEWISLTLPFPIYLKGYTIQGDAVDWRIYASLTPNVTSSWTVVHTGARTNPTYAQSNTYTLNLTGPYIKFVMKIKRSKMAAGFGRGCMKSIAYKGNPA
jgi:hypothetical protein